MNPSREPTYLHIALSKVNDQMTRMMGFYLSRLVQLWHFKGQYFKNMSKFYHDLYAPIDVEKFILFPLEEFFGFGWIFA